jgi:methyl-accepting chemotaxis protein
MKMPSLTKLPISLRLLTVLGVFAISLIIMSYVGYRSLNLASNSTSDLHDLVGESTRITEVLSNVQSNFVNTVNRISNGTLTWLDGAETIATSQQLFNQQWQGIQSQPGFDSRDLTSAVPRVEQAYSVFISLTETQSRAGLELFVLNDLNPLVNPFLNAAQQYGATLTLESETSFTTFENTFAQSIVFNSILIVVTALTTSVVGWIIYNSILRPVRQISSTMSEVQANNPDARTGLVASRDELSTLGATLDALLNEKNTTLEKIETENDKINDSVIELLEGTSQLSDRDLTVRLTVREDITGPVADAMNMATSEIGEALAKIRQISDLVGAASSLIGEQSSRVNSVTENERQLVTETINKLEAVSSQMMQIAKWSQASNQVAKKATASTDSAYTSVTNTMASMEEIRNTISETEKRIKRLSERSQEISSIIDIINSIAERTHVLALNASMQAAAAGDAGRGFAVVADEVQRLAESSRDSTSQISVLVRNIQTETAAAVDTMNASINEVVSGSKLAQLAGEQMKETQSTTKDLARAVAKISEQSILQAKETDSLKTQSHLIQESTEQTFMELKRQTEQTKRLISASDVLATTVSVFSLPKHMLETHLAAELMSANPTSAVVQLGQVQENDETLEVLDTPVKAIG